MNIKFNLINLRIECIFFIRKVDFQGKESIPQKIVSCKSVQKIDLRRINSANRPFLCLQVDYKVEFQFNQIFQIYDRVGLRASRCSRTKTNY